MNKSYTFEDAHYTPPGLRITDWYGNDRPESGRSLRADLAVKKEVKYIPHNVDHPEFWTPSERRAVAAFKIACERSIFDAAKECDIKYKTVDDYCQGRTRPWIKKGFAEKGIFYESKYKRVENDVFYEACKCACVTYDLNSASEKYKIPRSTIYAALTGRIRKWVIKKLNKEGIFYRPTRLVYPDDKIRAAYKMACEMGNIAFAARSFGLAYPTLSTVINRTRRPYIAEEMEKKGIIWEGKK